jgi:N-acetylmuramoyl-L-alanine amidase
MLHFITTKRLINKVFIHCSASDIQAHDDISIVKSWHLQRGFRDVGYHFFIKKDGSVQIGRSLKEIPASQAGHNIGTIAICVSGNKHFTAQSLKSLRLLCDQLNAIYCNKLTFHGHCELFNKNFASTHFTSQESFQRYLLKNPAKTCPNFNYRAILSCNINKIIDVFIK